MQPGRQEAVRIRADIGGVRRAVLVEQLLQPAFFPGVERVRAAADKFAADEWESLQGGELPVDQQAVEAALGTELVLRMV